MKAKKHSFGRRLQDLRDIEDWNKSETASKLNIPAQTYNHYENGRNEPEIDRLFEIADFYGVSIDYLLGHDYVNKKYELPNSINNSKEAADLLNNIGFILKDKSDDEKIEIAKLIFFILKK